VVRLKSQGELCSEETTDSGYIIRATPRGSLAQELEKYKAN
jgi:hypothetical protein